jgi:hypothetical protein
MPVPDVRRKGIHHRAVVRPIAMWLAWC